MNFSQRFCCLFNSLEVIKELSKAPNQSNLSRKLIGFLSLATILDFKSNIEDVGQKIKYTKTK